MRNKGAIILLTILLAVVSAYQLFFTFKTSQVESDAREYANLFAGDSLKELKEAEYLDSVANKEVYSLMGITGYTYKECKELELPLGLDLRGGMNVTMEVDVADVVKNLANNSLDSTFNKAIQEARKLRVTDRRDFVTIFGEVYEKMAPGASLASPDIFGTVELKEKIKMNATNAEVLKVIREETEGSINNTFNILRTRIDRFGVAQPNIRKAEVSGRILIELPGIKDPQRVRKLLQGTAALEFFETYENSEFMPYLATANEKIRLFEQANAKEVVAENVEETKETVAADSSKSLLSEISAAADTTKINADKDAFRKEQPLYALLNPAIMQDGNPIPGSIVGYALVKDTAAINAWLALPQVKASFPRNARLMWEMKAEATEYGERIAMHAIKVSTRDGKAPLDGGVVVDARKEFDERGGAPYISMNMNGEGSRTWARLTKENIGRCVAIVLDGMVVSSPRVNDEIKGGRSQITGNFDVKEAEDFANILKSGKLPAPAKIIADKVVGPSLGQESIETGMWSFGIAFVLILVYMVFFYGKGAGLAADIALLANLFFLFGILASLGAVLTLPGIAGIVLTMGMAVDANVLIFERVEEERRAGKSLVSAIKDGYKGALSAIVDGNVTTMLTGFILYYFGEGPIKGFATTLIIGLFSSLFCSIFISRLILESAARKRTSLSFTTKLTAEWLRDAKIKFLENRKIGYTISSILVIVSLVSLFTKGFDKGIDFVGGRSYTIKFEQPVQVESIASSLAEVYGSAPEVKTVGTSNQVKITTKYKIAEEGKEVDTEVEQLLYKGLTNYLPDGTTEEEFLSTDRFKQDSEKVGPAVAEDITRAAFWSIFFALLVMFLYIMVRFSKWQYGASAVITLGHDVIIIMGAFSLFAGILPFSLEIDQAFIAAILTIVGYSINDTVVVFDRLREYHAMYPKRNDMEVSNAALNSTLRRTFSTSLSTLVVLLSIFMFGGASIRGFIFALLVGVIVGTYSSVFVATPLSFDLRKNKMK